MFVSSLSESIVDNKIQLEGELYRSRFLIYKAQDVAGYADFIQNLKKKKIKVPENLKDKFATFFELKSLKDVESLLGTDFDKMEAKEAEEFNKKILDAIEFLNCHFSDYNSILIEIESVMKQF